MALCPRLNWGTNDQTLAHKSDSASGFGWVLHQYYMNQAFATIIYGHIKYKYEL